MTGTLAARTTDVGRRLFGHNRQARPKLWTELALVVVGYSLYTITRDAVPGQKAVAMRRAAAVLRTEHSLHIDIELTVNHALDKITPLIVGLNYYYATLHFFITIGVLIWLYVRHPQAYRSARTVLFLVILSSLIGFYFFAMAPPRLLTGHGFIDTNVEHHTWGSFASPTMQSVSNQYAAMPSDHIAWAGWCAVMIYKYAGHRWIRVAGLIYPLFTFTAIIGTANHFVADAVGGALTLAAEFAIHHLAARLWQRRTGQAALPPPRAQHDGDRHRHQGTLGEQRGAGDPEPAVEQRDG
ncbi:phosphatase PAP2 family protein [Catenulispora sp. NL8]|uniref:Phosphatase PAP2 family protein n=1 Tax=Catenulispora pinistramenti TaxID=2705254 RepID=A0ABS5L4B0_9ACTN|nr:phosphatase PAP2 family protein [Catenulispora pinistramenti]MBS2552974.1 phosphatase PAP2 family protein [Catenulispora pinistramenti]